MLLPTQAPGVRRNRRACPFSGLPPVIRTPDGIQPLQDADDMEGENGEEEEYGEADV